MIRPSWDTYFMDISKAVAKRSIDIHTKHGCVAVSDEHSILSTGYNGPPRNVDDTKIPLTRPEKYIYMEHSERNCIYNAARIGIPLNGCTFYVTGIPCIDCMRGMYQVGASEVVLLSDESHSTTDEWYDFIEFIKVYMRVRYV